MREAEVLAILEKVRIQVEEFSAVIDRLQQIIDQFDDSLDHPTGFQNTYPMPDEQ